MKRLFIHIYVTFLFSSIHANSPVFIVISVCLLKSPVETSVVLVYWVIVPLWHCWEQHAICLCVSVSMSDYHRPSQRESFCEMFISFTFLFCWMSSNHNGRDEENGDWQMYQLSRGCCHPVMLSHLYLWIQWKRGSTVRAITKAEWGTDDGRIFHWLIREYQVSHIHQNRYELSSCSVKYVQILGLFLRGYFC